MIPAYPLSFTRTARVRFCTPPRKRRAGESAKADFVSL